MVCYEQKKKTIFFIREKCIDTCNNKYGVDWFCLSDNFSKYCGCESKPNKMFYDRVLEKGVCSNNIFKEFSINSYRYDYRINNMLIEINPWETHNVEWSPYGKPLEDDYHLKKALTAFSNNYSYLTVWDWTNLDSVCSFISDCCRFCHADVNNVHIELYNSVSLNELNMVNMHGFCHKNCHIYVAAVNNAFDVLCIIGMSDLGNGKYWLECFDTICLNYHQISKLLIDYFIGKVHATSVQTIVPLDFVPFNFYTTCGFNVDYVIDGDCLWFDHKNKKVVDEQCSHNCDSVKIITSGYVYLSKKLNN